MIPVMCYSSKLDCCQGPNKLAQCETTLVRHAILMLAVAEKLNNYIICGYTIQIILFLAY